MSERILVVDDDDRIAAIVWDGLSRMGYRVELAADGPAALAAVGGPAVRSGRAREVWALAVACYIYRCRTRKNRPACRP